MSYCLKFCVQVLGGADVVGSPGEGSDDAVLRGVGGAGGVLRVEVGVGRFTVDGGGLVRMDEDVEEGDRSVRGRVFLGEGEVFSEGVEEVEVGFSVGSVSESSKAVVHEVAVGVGRIRGRVQ